jgi:hypothetical protein
MFGPGLEATAPIGAGPRIEADQPRVKVSGEPVTSPLRPVTL